MKTQQEINECFAPLKAQWDEKVRESGKSDAMFIATDKTGFAATFIHNYNSAKTAVEAHGLKMPELVKGLSVSYSDSQ